MELYPHQVEGIKKMKDIENKSNGGILAFSPGLGKTLTMSIFARDKHTHKIPTLIVAPISILEIWKTEIINAYTKIPSSKSISEPKIIIYHGNKRKQKYNPEEYYDFIITSYSIIAKNEIRRNIERIILDEAHIIRNLFNKPGKSNKLLLNFRKKWCKYAWCVTATPFQNKCTDLASLAMFIDTYPYNDKTWWKYCNNTSIDFINEKILDWKDNFVIIKKKDGILSPPKITEIKLKQTLKEKEFCDMYKYYLEEEFAKWKYSHGIEKAKLQTYIIGLITKLMVYTNSIYCGEEKIKTKTILKECIKIKRVVNDTKNLVKKDKSKSVVIFSYYTSCLKILKSVFEENTDLDIYEFNGSHNTYERNNTIEKFKTSKSPRILLISLTAGGVGLTLLPCSTLILLEHNYNPMNELQAQDRIHRIGQKEKVNIYRYTVKNSIEEWVKGVKERKIASAKLIEFNGEIIMSNKDAKIKSSVNFSNDIKLLFEKSTGREKEREKERKKERKKDSEHLLPPKNVKIINIE